LVVGEELGRREAVLAGPLIPVAEAERLGEQGPLGGQPPRLLGVRAGGGLLGMAADPDTRQVVSSERVTPLYRTDSRA
jgi:hypothetical protein